MVSMDKGILQQLYDGEIYPAENVGKNNSELQKMNDFLSEGKTKFIKSLSDKDREDFQKIDDLQNESAIIYGYECFAHGFKLAATLMLESFSDKKGFD